MCYRKIDTIAVSKDEWDTKADTGKPMRMHCTYCGMSKGTSQAEVTSNSEKIKPIALAVIELHLSEGISQSVSRKFDLILFSKIPKQLVECVSRQSESLFGLSLT